MKRISELFFITFLFCCNVGLADDASIARGRYLTVIAGCNDCHTSGFAQSGGKLPESEWLKGDGFGWKGPWGTSYPINLRLLLNSIPPEAWLALAKNSKARPPMPAYALAVMPDEDLLAIYNFVRSLGSAGTPMPAALPPGVEPTTPYFNFTPVFPTVTG